MLLYYYIVYKKFRFTFKVDLFNMIICNWYAKFLDDLYIPSQSAFDCTRDTEYMCKFAKCVGYMPE